MRMMHEASLHEDNVFITLTYSPEHIPPDGGLVKSDFQLFMKRLRKSTDKKFKFYMCGEYGDRNNRPHYHAILFGYNFDDWQYILDSPSGYPIYTSEKLSKIWGKGFVTIGEVTFESAAYVARYVVKKITGKLADQVDKETGLKPYERVNAITGEISEVLPEYSTMSRGGRGGHGIGRSWIEQYRSDCYPKDFTTVRGVKCKPPRYYDNFLREIDLDMYDEIKEGRQLSISQNFDSTPGRNLAKETVKQAQNKQLKRTI